MQGCTQETRGLFSELGREHAGRARRIERRALPWDEIRRYSQAGGKSFVQAAVLTEPR